MSAPDSPGSPPPPPAAGTRAEPLVLQSASGLRWTFNANGSLRRIDHGGVMLNLFPGLEIEGGPANLWLRRHGADGCVQAVALLGPASPLPPLARVAGEAACAASEGRIDGVDVRLQLRLAADEAAWYWHVQVRDRGTEARPLSLLHAQDVGLAAEGAIRLNEYYVSHYLDFTPLEHPRAGRVLAVRQNRAVDGRFPWLLLGALDHARAFATDAMQLHDPATRSGEAPAALTRGLPDRRLQHEHAMAVLEGTPRTVAPGAWCELGFFARYVADHPPASGPPDLALADAALAAPEARRAPAALPRTGPRPARSLFATAAWLDAHDLADGEIDRLFPPPHRHEEREAGERLSFFRGEHAHVVLRAKERRVMRPHGMLLRSGARLVPDEAALTSTVWMGGVFHSMLTQGHVGINRFLSTVRSWLGLFRSQGQRVFVRTRGDWRQLGVPSAFEMTPLACRWWYRHDGGLIEVEAAAGAAAHELHLRLQVHEGEPLDWLVTHDVCLGGDHGAETPAAPWHAEGDAVVVRVPAGTPLAARFPHGRFRLAPQAGTQVERIGDDALLWEDGRSRGQPFVCLTGRAARQWSLCITGELIEPARPGGGGEAPAPTSGDAPAPALAADTPLALPRLAHVPGAAATAVGATPRRDLSQLGEALPWLLRDALVHYLSPRGLEQFSGGGWGTRDVCQGPLELLLALGRPALARDLVERVLRAQDAGGDWPQWFMFFDRERALRAGDSHGDIVLWPVLAAARVLLAEGDAAWLDTPLPFHAGDGDVPEVAPVWEHLQRALAVARARRIDGTALVAYGHGDWNDSLQPADPALREHLCSAWTVTLHHQALATLARALREAGAGARADALAAEARAVAADFRRLLVVDDQVAGYALFPPGGEVEWMLHPRDRRTGLGASLLPMMHAVLGDLLSPAQARAQREAIDARLMGPDGARLFDRPLPYHGGPERLFQRAESSAFFGREIGVMYMHAHIRQAEMRAHLGDGAGLLHALALAQPVGLRPRVPAASLRQSNCYYSSSDAAFADRYEAERDYGAIARGEVALDGGWRVYSSGPGILIAAVVERLLGLRQTHARLVFDPVLPPALDGLEIDWPHGAHTLRVRYRLGPDGHGPLALRLGAHALAFEREPNPYRRGGAAVERAAFEAAVAAGERLLVVETG